MSEQGNGSEKQTNIYIWWYSVAASLSKKQESSAWDELKQKGYTIERSFFGGWYLANAEGRRCGKVHGTIDALFGELEEFAKLELSRI